MFYSSFFFYSKKWEDCLFLLISSFLVSDVSESLIWLKSLRFISLTKNERPWAIHSSRSEEMSDVNKSLISLTKNERMSESLIFLSELLICSFLDKKWEIARKSNERIPNIQHELNQFCPPNTSNLFEP